MAEMDSWNYIETNLYDGMAGGFDPLYSDRTAQTLFDHALFEGTPLGGDDGYWVSSDDRAVTLDALRDYLYDEYGIDFDASFDWEAYREAYG